MRNIGYSEELNNYSKDNSGAWAIVKFEIALLLWSEDLFNISIYKYHN